jgi:hypothetical protein
MTDTNFNTQQVTSAAQSESSRALSSRTSRVVMARVHTIHAVKTFMTTNVLAALVFAVSLWGIGREVWVSRVFQNMPSLQNIPAVVQFYLAAFHDTRTIVQVLALLTAAAFVWLLSGIISMLRQASLGSASGYRWQ